MISGAPLLHPHQASKNGRYAVQRPHCCAVVCIQGLDGVQDSAANTEFLQHLPQHSMRYSIERLPGVNKATVQLASFPFLSSLFLLFND